MKKINKKYVPSYTVDLDDIESLDDIKLVFALGKHRGGYALTDEELFSIIEWTAEHVAPKIDLKIYECKCPEKKPWYKRAWNTIKKPFTKKKK